MTSLKKQLSDPTTESSESDGEVAPDAAAAAAAQEALAMLPSEDNEDFHDGLDSLPVLERQRSFSPAQATSEALQQSDLRTRVNDPAASESDTEVHHNERSVVANLQAPPVHTDSDEDSMPDLSQND